MDRRRPVWNEAGAEDGPELTSSRTVVVRPPSPPPKTPTPPSTRAPPRRPAPTSPAARLRMLESIAGRYSPDAARPRRARRARAGVGLVEVDRADDRAARDAAGLPRHRLLGEEDPRERQGLPDRARHGARRLAHERGRRDGHGDPERDPRREGRAAVVAQAPCRGRPRRGDRPLHHRRRARRHGGAEGRLRGRPLRPRRRPVARRRGPARDRDRRPGPLRASRAPAAPLGQRRLDRDRRRVDRPLARLPRVGERRLELQDGDRRPARRAVPQARGGRLTAVAFPTASDGQRGVETRRRRKDGFRMAELVADYVLGRLTEWGVHRIYGYPGDGINAFLGAFDRAGGDPEFIQVRHEEMAAFMACGHATFTGEFGVCIATSGPGAIHLLNGLYDAKPDHQPVVAIVGQTFVSALGSDMQQEVDLLSLYKDVAAAYVQQVNTPA